MDVLITPSPLRGRVAAIPSKSDAHRLLICAALADSPTDLRLPSSSEDIDTTIGCLEAMGARFRRRGDILTAMPPAEFASAPRLDCAESGSTLRFLLPVAAALCPGASFTGRGRLPQRPLDDLTNALKSGGVSFSQETLPFELGGGLRPGEFTLPGNVSSQYISGLLFALPRLSGGSRVALSSPLSSSAYVEMTLSALSRFGVSIVREENGFFVPGAQRFVSPGAISVEGDWSAAAFFLVAGAICGETAVSGLSGASSQADRAVCDILKSFGACMELRGDTASARPDALHGREIDIDSAPDLLPILAVAAAFADGETVFRGAGRLRFKESDRIASAAAMLRSLGGEAREGADSLTVMGGGLSGGETDCFGDHRIAMAAAIAGACCKEPVHLKGAQAVNKSYPGFFEAFCALGGKAHVI